MSALDQFAETSRNLLHRRGHTWALLLRRCVRNLPIRTKIVSDLRATRRAAEPTGGTACAREPCRLTFIERRSRKPNIRFWFCIK